MKTFVVIYQGFRVSVYDTSITKSFEESQILASVVSLSSSVQDVIDAHTLAINVADLYEDRLRP